MANFWTIPTYYHQLDPVLSHPTRLFIVTLLVEMQWCEFEAIRDSLEMGAAPLSCHLAKLHQQGYIESHGEWRTSQWRLTPLGRERLAGHLDELRAAVTRAGEALASNEPLDPEPTA
jgi:predicted transcriptional regulator